MPTTSTLGLKKTKKTVSKRVTAPLQNLSYLLNYTQAKFRGDTYISG